MTLRPGSLAWLVANDLRLNWRRLIDMLGSWGASTPLVLAVLCGGGLLLHLLAWPLLPVIAPLVHAGGVSALLVAMLGSTFTWMVAQSLFSATRTLYDRGDLDLLLGSPLPSGRVIAAKAIAIAASTCGSVAFLTLPVANVGALLDRTAWLAVYPVLVAFALIATVMALALAMALFFLLGAKRARLYANMTGAVIGGAFVLAAQIIAMLPDTLRTAVTAWIETGAGLDGTAVGALLRLPAEAVRGDAAAIATLLAFAATALIATLAALGQRFARDSLAAAGAPAGGSTHRRGRFRFHGGVAANLRRKEWRLIARDPSLFAQLGLQMVYTVPVAVVLMRSETLPAALVLAPTIVVIASQIAASLAWLTVSGEDAPELMATAPVSSAAIDRAKLGAIAVPVALIIALPLAGLAVLSWPVALIVAVCAAAAAVSTALLNLWHPMPGNRRGMLRRHSQSKLVGVVEHALAILWAVAVLFASVGMVLTVVPVLLAAGLLGACRLRHRSTAVGRPAPGPAATARPALSRGDAEAR